MLYKNQNIHLVLENIIIGTHILLFLLILELLLCQNSTIFNEK